MKQERASIESEFRFDFNLSAAPAGEASVDFHTSAGSALSDKDFVPASGTLVFPVGTKSATITIKVKGDSARRSNQIFSIDLSNPRNCKFGSDRVIGTIVNENLPDLAVENVGYTTPSTYANYTLVWSDEFSGRSINTYNWTFETGGNGWGNHELETYLNNTRNAFVSRGNLIIEARNDATPGVPYSSARIITKGKKSFQYGRIDIRARLPKGKGIWPALWMLGSNIDQVGWPACGEIDIMELVGDAPNKVYGTFHWGPSHQSYGSNYALPSGIFNDQFHVFSLDWDAAGLNIYVDNQPYANLSLSSGTYPFSSKFFFIFNVAVGGDWPGAPDASTTFPQRMIVDYVRVFQK